MSNFVIYLVIDAAGVLFCVMFVLLFRALICEKENSSSSALQMKSYSKAGFLNALAKLQ